MTRHKADKKSSHHRGAGSSAGQQQKRSKKKRSKADLLGWHNKPWDCRDQIETAFVDKIPKLPTEIGFLLTMPAANNGPVRIHSQNLTTRQRIAMVKALNRTLAFPQPRLTTWVEQEAAGKPRGRSKQSKVQQQQQKKAHRQPPAQRQQQSSGGLGGLCLAGLDASMMVSYEISISFMFYPAGVGSGLLCTGSGMSMCYS
jgi:hypothetical protein